MNFTDYKDRLIQQINDGEIPDHHKSNTQLCYILLSFVLIGISVAFYLIDKY